MKRTLVLFLVVTTAVLVTGTVRDSNFWRTADQRGDVLLRKEEFAEAAKTYTGPERIGIAQYRDGAFEAAAKTFARVPGATGAFNQGNALLMHGQYDAAIASYDRALGFRAGWKDAEENRALALARKAKIDASGEDRDQAQSGAYTPDEIKYDQTGENRSAKPVELSATGPGSDAELQATWLRRVQTTPGDFLRAKFAYQAAHRVPPGQGAGK